MQENSFMGNYTIELEKSYSLAARGQGSCGEVLTNSLISNCGSCGEAFTFIRWRSFVVEFLGVIHFFF